MKSLFIEPLIPLCDAEAAASAEERTQMHACAPARRRESLAWRALVRRELGADTQIAYDAVGAPVITNRNIYIGISHGAGRIAVCISDTPCAVDIESPERNFTRVISRYMTDSERALSDDPLLPAAIWCAKETLYKLSGRTGLNFHSDLRIEKVDLESGVIVGRIFDEEPVVLSVRRAQDYIAVYLL